MKFYQKRSFALIVLIAAVALAAFYGISRKPAALIDVKLYNWVADTANILSEDTEAVVDRYNTAWDDKYVAVTAVATVKDTKGRTLEEYANELGKEWGLGEGDMLLLISTDPSDSKEMFWVSYGDTLAGKMTGVQGQLQAAINEPIFKGDYDDAVTAFYRAADIAFSQVYASGQSTYN